MLVLTRKLGQSITIGDPASPITAIEVKIVEVRETGQPQVRLGIMAPPGVIVDRKEVFLLKQDEKQP